MSGNFSYGHSNMFWDLLFRTIEDGHELPEEQRYVYLISPWIRDIELSSSHIGSEDLRDMLDDYSGSLSKLSDVLIAMKKVFGFKINILTLDSADTVLPKSERSWLDLESRMINQLVGADVSNPMVPVWKKIGVHAKMYVFPSGALSGSVNLTNAGLFLNGENLSYVDRDENGDLHNQTLINAEALISGSQSYHSETNRTYVFNIPSDNEGSDRELRNLEPINSNFPDPKQDIDAYVIPPEIALGRLQNTGGQFLNDQEADQMNRWIRWYESEMRTIVKFYFSEYANRMKNWVEGENADFKDEISTMWHHKIIVKSHGDSLHDSAVKVISKGKYRSGDFPEGIMDDLKNLSPDEALIYGSVINDLWTCIYGSKQKPFKDYAGTDLTDKSLYFFTTQVLGLGKHTNQTNLEKFWHKY